MEACFGWDQNASQIQMLRHFEKKGRDVIMVMRLTGIDSGLASHASGSAAWQRGAPSAAALAISPSVFSERQTEECIRSSPLF